VGNHYWASLIIDEELGDRPGIAASYHQLGMIAELRGDYAQAERRYQNALTIDEELGDRAGIAASYHQLGIIAQLREDYAQAEQRYQDSLTIAEERGDRADIASSTSQLGALHTERGDPVEAVAYNLTALSIRYDIGSPDVSVDLYWLARQQREIGEDAFRQILDAHLDPDTVMVVLDLIAQVAPDDE
jgi:tetratricopeptide (TPR) repeat protein